MKQAIWISYDLGIKGDYPGLYRWLDLHKAKECGNSCAYLKYEFTDDIRTELKADLERNISFNPGDRIYVVISVIHQGKEQYLGQFLFGNRKASPWEGFAPNSDTTTDTTTEMPE